MPDGSQWDVPAELIARHAAKYHCDKQTDGRGGEEYCKVFADVLAEYLADDEKLIDWAENNMNWADVSHAAKLHRQPDETDYARGWVNGAKEVVLL